jgi:hypothetical protein
LAERSNKLASMTNDEWDDLYVTSLSNIHLCPGVDVLFNIVGEEITTCMWTILEGIYMTKSPTNRIYLKMYFYGL